MFVELLRSAYVDQESSYPALPATFVPELDASTLIVLGLNVVGTAEKPIPTDLFTKLVHDLR